MLRQLLSLMLEAKKISKYVSQLTNQPQLVTQLHLINVPSIEVTHLIFFGTSLTNGADIFKAKKVKNTHTLPQENMSFDFGLDI